QYPGPAYRVARREQRVVETGVGRQRGQHVRDRLGVRAGGRHPFLRLGDPAGRDELLRLGDLLGGLDRADPPPQGLQLGRHGYFAAFGRVCFRTCSRLSTPFSISLAWGSLIRSSLPSPRKICTNSSNAESSAPTMSSSQVPPAIASSVSLCECRR